MLKTFIITLLLVLTFCISALAAPLKVCATVPELGSLVERIGGEHVSVFVFAHGFEDPHHVLPKPSFVTAVHNADLFAQVGLELEVGWAPVLIEQGRNLKIRPGSAGFLDASTAITPLDIPGGSIDRSMGDIHPYGNPHYLLDPIMGLAVARAIDQKLSTLDTAHKADFHAHLESFSTELAEHMLGAELAKKYDVEKMVRLYETGTLKTFLQNQNDLNRLGGWLGAVLPYRGTRVVDDHPVWPYFAKRFGLEVVGHLEPKPGVPPSTKNLNALIELMRNKNARIVLTTPYYDTKYAQFLAKNAGAIIVPMTHQVGGRTGSDSYLDMIDYNIKTLVSHLK